MLLIAHVEVRFEAFNISAELLVFVSELHVEVLLEVQVSLHVGHLAVPEVQFVSLLRVVLLHQGHASVNISLSTVLVFDIAFELLHAALQGELVRIEGSPQGLSSFAFFSGTDLLDFELLQTIVDLSVLSYILFESQFVLLLTFEFDLLEIFECRCQLSQVASELAILLGELLDFSLQQIHVVDSRPVSHGNVKNGLNAMIFLVKEVDLVLKLLHVTLVSLVLILLSQLVHVLATLVELAQSQNFVVSDLDGIVESAGLFFGAEMLLDELLILMTKFVCSFISAAQFRSPFLVLDSHTTVVISNVL